VPGDARAILMYAQAFCPVSETFVHRIGRGIAEHHQVSVLTHRRMNADEFPDAGMRVVVRPEKAHGRFSRALSGAWNGLRAGVPSAQVLSQAEFDRAIAETRPDAVLAQFGTCGFRILPAARRRGIPVVTMFHGCDLGSWLSFPHYRTCLDALFRGGSAFIVATDFMRAKAAGLGCPSALIHKIPYPIPPLPLAATRAGPDRFTFLHVGRLHEQKGILFTIRAFAKVREKTSRAELVIVGDGPQRSEAVALTEALGLASCVHFRGAIPFSRVREQLAAAHAYVIHSVTTADGDTEGFGVSLAEASMTGLPIVATAHNGFPDVVLEGKTGFLVAEGNVEEMALAMTRLCDDPGLCLRMGAAGRAHVEENFSPARVASLYRELFSAVVGRHPEDRVAS
jgi:colanic acid/amylovoran biosynthesis glycosyltransferase